MSTATYVCSGCGGGSVTVLEGRPAVDERYAIGFCEQGCTPVPDKVVVSRKTLMSQPANRRTIPLIRGDVFDAAALGRRRQLEDERRLLAKVRNDTANANERGEVNKLLARYEAEAIARRAG